MVQKAVLCIVFVLVPTFSVSNKNVCNSAWDYLIRPFSKNCWFNPNVGTDMPELVTQFHYPLEEYFVTTDDGYILRIHRLPKRHSQKGVVLLLHPATSSSAGWVDKGNQSLGYMLYHKGYDVWLGNFRGSFYSRNHTVLDPDKNITFWDYSFHEMGVQDIPKTIEKIKEQTNTKKITIIGYSISGAASVIYASLFPQHAVDNINAFIIMAPAVFFGNTKTPLKYLAPYQDIIVRLAYKLGLVQFGTRSTPNLIVTKLCYKTFLLFFCRMVQDFFFGQEREEFSYPLFPVMYTRILDGISIKCVGHFAQAVNLPGTFRMYDYGKARNLERYNSSEPSSYPIHKIKSLFYILYGKNDLAVTEKDAKLLYKTIKSASPDKHHRLDGIDNFAHFNFFYSKHFYKKINLPIANFVDKLSFA